LNQPYLLRSQSDSRTAPRESRGDACLDAYQLHLDYVLRTLRRLGVDRRDLEDMSHEVFLVLWRGWERYDPTRDFKPYLFGIVFRIAASHRRKYWRELSSPMVDRTDGGPSPELAIQAEQDRAVVLAALSCVPLQRRSVLIMRDLDEISMTDVAATLSIPLFTAYSRLRKARREVEAAIREIQSHPKRSVGPRAI